MTIAWMLFITCLVLVIQSFVFSRFGLNNIKYERSFSIASAFEGEEVQMVERISNEKILPVPWVRVESSISKYLKFSKQFGIDIKDDQFHKSLFSLMPFMAITRKHKVTCLKRGKYQLNSVSLTMGDPFGLREKAITIGLHEEIKVYPKIIPVSDIVLPSHSFLGDIIVRRWIVEDPFIISGSRNYNNGDPMSRINWKATARVGKFQVHNYDYTTDPKMMIYLNFEITEDMWGVVTEPELIEKGLSYAASIAQMAIGSGIATGFGCNGYLSEKEKNPVRVPMRVSSEHMTALLEIMAELTIGLSISFFTFLEQDIEKMVTNTDYLIITPYISERLTQQTKRLALNGNSVKLLELKMDKDLLSDEGKDEN
jgi:uncharacterized protein (DUF58 family)